MEGAATFTENRAAANDEKHLVHISPTPLLSRSAAKKRSKPRRVLRMRNMQRLPSIHRTARSEQEESKGAWTPCGIICSPAFVHAAASCLLSNTCSSRSP